MPWAVCLERLTESGVRFLEAMKSSRDLRTDIECGCGLRRQRDRLGGDDFRPVMVRDTTKHATAREQQLRERDQALEGSTFSTTTLQAIDRCRKVGDGDCTACITSGIDHDAFFNPVSSAG